MVRKVIWRWKYSTNHSQGKNIYIGKNIYRKKKEKDQPCHTNWKESKDTQLVGQKEKKTPLGLLSYNEQVLNTK